MRRSLILVGSIAAFSPFAAAQRHTGMSMRSMAPRPAAVASPAVGHIAPAGVVHLSSPTRAAIRVITTHTRTGGTIVRVIRPANIPRHRAADDDDMGFSSAFSPAPGLGFDETHFAATRSRRAIGAHRRGRLNAGFFPFFDGGFFLPTPIVVTQAPANEVQEEIVEPDAQERVQRARPRESAPAYSTEVSPAAKRDTEEYVFVRRDGTVFFAVAYSWDNGTLRYITQDGLRRSVAGNALDLGATQQFNEQRGLSFNLPV
jgi:hypothetical protein